MAIEVLRDPGVGTYETGGAAAGNVSVESEVGTSVCSVTVGPGTWLLVGTLIYQTNGKGVRAAKISDSAGSVTNATAAMQRVPAVSGAYTIVQASSVARPTEERTYHLNAYQDSGSTLTVGRTLRAVRVA